MSTFMSIDEFNGAQVRLGLNNTKLAKALGIQRGTVQRYKNGTRVIPQWVKNSLDNLIKIQELLQNQK